MTSDKDIETVHKVTVIEKHKILSHYPAEYISIREFGPAGPIEGSCGYCRNSGALMLCAFLGVRLAVRACLESWSRLSLEFPADRCKLSFYFS